MKLKGLAHYHVLANEMLRQHGLYDKGWRAEWMERNSITKCGTCQGARKKIWLNHDYFHLTPEHDVLVDTILHEIAHAIDFERRGMSDHSNIWKQIAISIGCNGKRLNDKAVMPTKKTRGNSFLAPEFEVY